MQSTTTFKVNKYSVEYQTIYLIINLIIISTYEFNISWINKLDHTLLITHKE